MTEQKRTPGRPATLKDPVTQHVSLEKKQRKHCVEMGGSVSAYIRKLIDQDMEKHNA
mgnify:CR=1 FL=1|tara:strand:- start:471 stop:641 length:171 start_codon:yes stop_codon:yes gene_type:complete